MWGWQGRRYLVLRSLVLGGITNEPLRHSVPEACWWWNPDKRYGAISIMTNDHGMMWKLKLKLKVTCVKIESPVCVDVDLKIWVKSIWLFWLNKNLQVWSRMIDNFDLILNTNQLKIQFSLVSHYEPNQLFLWPTSWGMLSEI